MLHLQQRLVRQPGQQLQPPGGRDVPARRDPLGRGQGEPAEEDLGGVRPTLNRRTAGGGHVERVGRLGALGRDAGHGGGHAGVHHELALEERLHLGVGDGALFGERHRVRGGHVDTPAAALSALVRFGLFVRLRGRGPPRDRATALAVLRRAIELGDLGFGPRVPAGFSTLVTIRRVYSIVTSG